MRALPLLTLPLILTACPGALGGGDPDDDGWGHCESEATVLDIDEVSGLGFSARELLESVAGPQTETIGYGESESWGPRAGGGGGRGGGAALQPGML